MSFKFGDVLINHYAGEGNPCKKTIFIRTTTKFYECICPYRNSKVEFYKNDHKLEKVGTILKYPLKDLTKQEEPE